MNSFLRSPVRYSYIGLSSLSFVPILYHRNSRIAIGILLNLYRNILFISQILWIRLDFYLHLPSNVVYYYCYAGINKYPPAKPGVLHLPGIALFY